MQYDDCWYYAGIISPEGYGLIQAKLEGKWKLLKAHRVLYENLHGVIPKELVCDHMCQNRRCINPAHIDIVDNITNLNRGQTRKTSCKHGHPFDEANTIIIEATGHRRCRECQLANQRRYNYKRPGRDNRQKSDSKTLPVE